jgi:thiamine biosynthesis lipoprotein
MTSRRTKLLVILITLLITITGCGPKHKEYNYSNFLLGAQCNIKFYYLGEERAREIIDIIDLELVRLDSLLNYFSENSLVTELNRTSRIKAPGDIIYLVQLSDSVSRLTGGLFDITVAPLLQAWGFYDEDNRIPGPTEIQDALKKVGYRRLRIKNDSLVVDPGVKVDFGGIAQGFAADRVVLILRQRHVRSAIIDIGGEVLVIGRSPEGRPWRVGIRNPRGKGIIETLQMEDSAVSTSGDYEKFFIVNDKRYPHIIDPRTGQPAQNFSSVTIIAKDAAYADAISTAVAVMGADDGINFLDSLGIQGIIYYVDSGELKRKSNR